MKSSLRLRFQAVRDAIPPLRRREASERIAQHVAQLGEFARAPEVLAYANFRGEVETEALANLANREGKVVALPRMEGSQLAFHRWAPQDPLVSNPLGIPEPGAGAPRLEPSPGSIIVVPGLAFDRRGARLGYGGGFYDRLLTKFPRPFRVGLAFAGQIVPALPSTNLDVPMDCVVTEDEVIRLPRREH